MMITIPDRKGNGVSIMTTQEIIDYCLTKNQSYVDYPFGEIPICVRVNKKIFAQVYPLHDDYKVTLKCDMMTGDFFRHQYPGVVVRGYHCPPVQQPYWNTVFLDRIPDEELLNMIDHAYDQVIKSFSKKVQGELFGRI
jgi:predicted DNA-binding protein (MmcQ/YjbR family)